MYSSGSRNSCSYICSGELKYTIIRTIFIASDGNPGLLCRNPRVPGTPVEKHCPMDLTMVPCPLSPKDYNPEC